MAPMADTPDAWLADRAPSVIRRWAERAVAGQEDGRRPPNAVTAFAARHHIPLDDPHRTGQAILRVLARVEAGARHAP